MNFFKHMTAIFSAVLFSIVLASCSSGGSSTSTNLEGTAATGKGITGIVYITDANGTEINVPTSADGSYTAQVAGMTPPFIVRVIPDDGSDTLYSFATAIGQTVNVTPLTNLALFLASGSTDLSAIYTGWDGTGLTQSAILDAQKKINANLEAQFVAAGLNAKSYDFLNTAFSTDGNGFDGILDLLTLNVDFNVGSFSIDISGTPFSFDVNISITGFDFGTGTGSGGGPTGSVTLAGDPRLPATASPAIGINTVNTFGGDTFEDTIWTFIIDPATLEQITIDVNIESIKPNPRVFVKYTKGSIPTGDFQDLAFWSSQTPGAGLVIDAGAKTVTFNNLTLTDIGVTASPDITIDGTLGYQ
jgi:hypothetical protein